MGGGKSRKYVTTVCRHAPERFSQHTRALRSPHVRLKSPKVDVSNASRRFFSPVGGALREPARHDADGYIVTNRTRLLYNYCFVTTMIMSSSGGFHVSGTDPFSRRESLKYLFLSCKRRRRRVIWFDNYYYS